MTTAGKSISKESTGNDAQHSTITRDAAANLSNDEAGIGHSIRQTAIKDQNLPNGVKPGRGKYNAGTGQS